MLPLWVRWPAGPEGVGEVPRRAPREFTTLTALLGAPTRPEGTHHPAG
jgi:hypothetical protein